MSPETYFAAARSRDARFDGRFFIAVVTTGIYCRPICPARTPLRKNVRFYPTAAAAEDAGFRPCLRCRPDTSAGTPAWSGTCATVARALRIIDETTDPDRIENLASRLGVTDRHLRRLFQKHVGASPISILQTRRLHLARSLLTTTSIPIADVAFGAGFASLRRFNDAIRKAYDCTPSDLRARKPKHATATTIRLAFRPPFRWDALAAFLTTRAITGVDAFADNRYERDGISIEPGDGNTLRMTIPPSLGREVHDLVVRARRMFDLAADPVAIDEHLRRDRLLPYRAGTRVPGAWEPFEVAVRAIVGQQISVRGATTIMERLTGYFDRFPAPSELADADLRNLGMPRSRIDAIQGMARAVAEEPALLTRAATLEETIERLTALRGIGPWTAHYIAMRALGEPDAFPDGDLGLRKAAAALGIDNLLERAERWRPWRAYAAMALWTSPPSEDALGVRRLAAAIDCGGLPPAFASRRTPRRL